MVDVKITDYSENKDLAIISLPAAGGSKKPNQIMLKSLPYKKSEVYNFRKYGLYSRGYEPPEYNLYEISAAEDADGIIRRTIQKKRALMAKAGYTLTGLNNRTRDYVELRFQQIGLAQGKTMKLLIKETGGDIVRFHNAFWHKVRSKDNSGGNKRLARSYGGTKTLNPISAYFRIAPETMRLKTDKNGNPKKYMSQMPDGRYQEYRPEDIIHFYFNRRAGLNISCPGLLPAVDDIRALRRVEEQVEMLIDRHLFPLYTLEIGTDDMPVQVYPDGTTEVEVWTTKVAEMPTSGGLVTSHRHKFDVLDTKENISVDKYLEHFKKRAYTSAGVSNLDMGEGQGMNRSTADNASKILIEDVKDYQDELKEFIEFEVINELLLERFDINVLREEHNVSFTWSEIDVESMMKMENHNAVMHTMNQITEDEMRTRNGNKIIDSDKVREKLHMFTHDKTKIDWETESAIAINNTKAATTTSKTKKSKSKTSKSTKVAKNKNQPTNQHGTNLGPTEKTSSMVSNGLRLSHLLGNIAESDRDFTKARLINWCFSLDYPKSVKDFSSRILNYIDNSVDEAYDALKSNTTSPDIIQDTIIHKLINFIEILENNEDD